MKAKCGRWTFSSSFIPAPCCCPALLHDQHLRSSLSATREILLAAFSYFCCDLRHIFQISNANILGFFWSAENLVGLARFELATTGLGNRCSIHLSYSPALVYCNTFRAARLKPLCRAVIVNQFGGLPGGAGWIVSGCKPGAILSTRSFLKMLGQYSFSKLFPALNPMRIPPRSKVFPAVCCAAGR